MQPYAILVPGSLITKKTAADYLQRQAEYLLSNLSQESAVVLSEIESNIVSAGFLTWEQVDEIELSVLLPF